jgi:hypothetical protein
VIDTQLDRSLHRRERLHRALAITPNPDQTRPTVERRRRARRRRELT